MVVLLLSPFEEAIKSCDQECLKRPLTSRWLGKVKDGDHDFMGHGGIFENHQAACSFLDLEC